MSSAGVTTMRLAACLAELIGGRVVVQVVVTLAEDVSDTCHDVGCPIEDLALVVDDEDGGESRVEEVEDEADGDVEGVVVTLCVGVFEGGGDERGDPVEDASLEKVVDGVSCVVQVVG